MEKTEHEMNYIRKLTQQKEILRNSLNPDNVEENSTVFTRREPNSTNK